MDPRITGSFPAATRPWSGSGKAEERAMHYEEDNPEAVAQRELCLNCTIPAEFCEGNCRGVAYSARYERHKKRKAFRSDAAMGLTAKQLQEKLGISENTARVWAKEFGLPVVFADTPKKRARKAKSKKK